MQSVPPVTALNALATALAWAADYDSALALAEAYASEGWKVDWGPCRTRRSTGTGGSGGGRSGLRSIYWPWLHEGAVALQKLGGAMQPSELARVDVHAVIFVDGLRMDLAQRLSAQLRDAGATVSLK